VASVPISSSAVPVLWGTSFLDDRVDRLDLLDLVDLLDFRTGAGDLAMPGTPDNDGGKRERGDRALGPPDPGDPADPPASPATRTSASETPSSPGTKSSSSWYRSLVDGVNRTFDLETGRGDKDRLVLTDLTFIGLDDTGLGLGVLLIAGKSVDFEDVDLLNGMLETRDLLI